MKKMKFTKKGLTLLAGGVILVGLLSGCSENTNSNDETISNTVEEVETIQEGQKEVFAPGEHILLLKNDSSSPRLTYHPGYEIAGTYKTSKGRTQIIYVNNVEVECTATELYKTKTYDYITFGTPIELEKEESKEYIKK